VLTRVISAARAAVDGVPSDQALEPLAAVAVIRSLARSIRERSTDGCRLVVSVRDPDSTVAEIRSAAGI
jgi:hypothetical protein